MKDNRVETPDEALRRTMRQIIHSKPPGRPTYERFASRPSPEPSEEDSAASEDQAT